MIVNNKEYPMWSQFVEKKDNWVGGTLEDFGDHSDRTLFPKESHSVTKITDITLEPNGTDSAYFSVDGEEFSCGFDVSCGGITGGEDGWVTFSGYGGHSWRIKERL